MAEPIALVALAGNVLQFLEWGGKFASKAFEICRHAPSSHDGPSNLKRLRQISSDLQGLVEKLSGPESSRKSEFMPLTSECREVIQEVLGKLARIDLNNNFKRTNLILTEFKATWHRRDIQELEARMIGLRDQLAAHLVVALRDLAFKSVTQQEEILSEIKALRSDRNDTGVMGKLRAVLGDNPSSRAPGEIVMQSISSHLEGDYEEDETSALMVAMRRKLVNLHMSRDGEGAETQDGIPEIQLPASRKGEIQQDFICSLNYKERNYRESAIASPYHNTFQWMFNDDPARKNGGFSKWLTSTSEVFWITGKPGSGKSTLMKYVSDFKSQGEGAQICHRQLTEWAGSAKLYTAGFYFWSSGSEIERSQNAMIRSLLFQLLEERPEIISTIAPAAWEAAYLFNTPIRGPWTDEELVQFLLRAAGQLLDGTTKLCIFIDGLDEFDGSPHVILSVIRRLLDLPDVKLCVSSRPWVDFGDEFDKRPSLRMQELTYPDIRHYVESHFDANQGFRRLKKREPEYAESLTRQIIQKSDGVFLWVRIVLQSLLAGLTNDDRIRDLESRLHSLPPELDQLYDKILKDVNSDTVYFQHACQYFELLLKLGGSTSAILLSFADEETEECSVRLSTRPLRKHKREERIETLRRRLNSRCKGLLEISRNDHVNFLHRTVRDYLQRPAIRSKMKDELEKTTFDPYMHLCSAYLAVIKTTVPLPSECPGPSLDDWQFLFNRCMNWAGATRRSHRVVPVMRSLHRVMRYHQDLLPQNLYIDDFGKPVIGLSVPDYFYKFSGDAFLNMAARNGVAEYLKLRASPGALSEVRCDLNEETVNRVERFFYGAWRNAVALGGRLTREGKQVTDGRRLPLLLDACLSGPSHADVFRVLLDKGADFNTVMRIPLLSIVWCGSGLGDPGRGLMFKTRGSSLLAVVIGAALMSVLSQKDCNVQRDLWAQWARILRLFVAHGAKLDETLALKVADRLRTGRPGLVWDEGEARLRGKVIYEVLKTVSTRDYEAVGSLLSGDFSDSDTDDTASYVSDSSDASSNITIYNA